MIDFVSITKRTNKYNPFLGHCQHYRTDQSGKSYYYLDGCEKMKVTFNPNTSVLELKGSLAYFIKGHNFSFSKLELVEAVDVVDAMLGGVGLWGSRVECFEYGTIVPVETKPKEYIVRHKALPDEHLRWVHNDKYKGLFEMWQDGGAHIKLYDARANLLLKQGYRRRQVIAQDGWNPELNYLKCEVRYTQPDLVNGNRPIILERLQDDEFINLLKGDLMVKYHRLWPARGLVYPKDKRDFTSLDAALYMIAEQTGLPLDEMKRRIYATIDQADCLSKCDKDGRKAQFRKAFKKLQEAPTSRWDLTALIEEALAKE